MLSPYGKCVNGEKLYTDLHVSDCRPPMCLPPFSQHYLYTTHYRTAKFPSPFATLSRSVLLHVTVGTRQPENTSS